MLQRGHPRRITKDACLFLMPTRITKDACLFLFLSLFLHSFPPPLITPTSFPLFPLLSLQCRGGLRPTSCVLLTGRVWHVCAHGSFGHGLGICVAANPTILLVPLLTLFTSTLVYVVNFALEFLLFLFIENSNENIGFCCKEGMSMTIITKYLYSTSMLS